MQTANKTDPNFTPENWLRAHAPTLGKMLPKEYRKQKNFDVRVIKISDTRMVMKLVTDQADFVIKAFNTDKATAIKQFWREVPAILSLKRTDLVPSIHGFSPEGAFFLADFKAGKTVLQSLTPETLVEMCRAIGAWYSKCAARGDTKQVNLTWFDYLSKYEALSTSNGLREAEALFRSLPIKTLSFAKNDAHLSNFVVGDDGVITGLDFEAAAFKPLGWDIMLTARVFAQIAPDRLEEAIDALIDGWGSGAADMDPATFRDLAHRFAILTAFNDLSSNTQHAEGYLKRFNARSRIQADAVFVTPTAEGALVPLDRTDVARLRRHIWKLAERARTRVQSGNRPAGSTASPSVPDLRPFCASCRGKCCGKGLKSHAFINEEDIQSAFQDAIPPDLRIVADHYLTHLPQRHVSGSCLFHSEKGCSLPVSKRSAMCGSYICKSGRSFLLALEKGEVGKTTLLIAEDEAQPTRAGIVENLILKEVDPGLIF